MGAGEQKILKNFSQSTLERQNLENQAMFELYTDDIKSKYSSNSKDIFRDAKNIMKNFTPRKQLLKLLLLNLLAHFLTERKYLMNM